MAFHIEIDSRRRNRNEWPLTTDFVVPFYGAPSPTVVDPVLQGVIYYTWTNPVAITGSVQPSSSDSSIVLDPRQTLPLSTSANAYNGMTIVITHQNGKVDTRVIRSYNPITQSITMQLAASSIQPGDPYTITVPWSLSSVYINSVDQFGNSVNVMEEAYRGYFLMDETLSYGTTIVAREVQAYNQSMRLLTTSPFPDDAASTDSYTLRQGLPLEKWQLASAPYLNQDPSQGPVGPVILLPDGASLQDGYYVGKQIYLTQPTPSVATQTPPVLVQVSGAFPVVAYRVVTDPVSRQVQRRAFVQYDQFHSTPLPAVNSVINVVDVAYDNFVPLNYIGSMTSLTTARCYEITLSELTLPNVSLITGSRIGFYPYVYVELKNLTSPESAADATTYSNNPDSRKTIFIAPVTDIVRPSTSAFVKLGNDMKKVIKFRPNDSFRFSVTLPNGADFQPQNSDLLTPYPSYERLQVHAVFSLDPI